MHYVPLSVHIHLPSKHLHPTSSVLQDSTDTSLEYTVLSIGEGRRFTTLPKQP